MKRLLRSEKGAGVLPVALILLGGAALMLLFTQRNLLLDLRITKNGYAHRLAYAAADSGLATVLTRLNDPLQRSQILTDRQAKGTYDTILQSVVQVPLGDQLNASVKIKGLALGGSNIRLQLQSMGCVAACDQGRAMVSQILAMRGGIHKIPYALITARGEVSAQGPVSIINQTAAVRGMLFHAGKAVVVDEAVQRSTVPGSGPETALIMHDKVLAQMSPDDFFNPGSVQTKRSFKVRRLAFGVRVIVVQRSPPLVVGLSGSMETHGLAMAHSVQVALP